IDMMMMTRSGTLAAAATDAVTLSNSKSSHPTSSRRPRSQVTKKYLIRITIRSNSTTGSRSPSSDSSSWSSTNSSHSSSN
ncbi:unnamed protein product, partial [Rotaria sp. Silwood2]